MAFSQNVWFRRGEPDAADDAHPPGEPLARSLAAYLGERVWNVSEVDNWRDVGWKIVCTDDGSSVHIALSQLGDGTWMLQVAPAWAPGLLGRALGRQSSATRGDCYRVAVDVHEFLTANGVSPQRWRWDGPPDERHGTSEPASWNG